MTEQQTTDLLGRITALEKQNRRQQWRLGLMWALLVFTFMLIAPEKLWREPWHFWLGEHGGSPATSMRSSGDSSTFYITSGRSLTTAFMDAHPEEAGFTLFRDDSDSRADLSVEKGQAAVTAEGSAGQAEASSTASTTGFYLYDKDGTLRAELSLNKQEPALIFYDAKGKELRRLRAAEK